VAWADGEPLGHVHLTDDDCPEMQDLSVRSEYRRRGVATALIAAAEQAARARNAPAVRLEVGVGNSGAHGLYEALGYVLTRRVDGTVTIRTGRIEVHDVLLEREKRLGQT
jgi:ribosomal protein S18 acetylase RimI-like enzyme